ncbi:MAG: hypothetical protein ACLR23_27515 [Clostridia bacterium]
MEALITKFEDANPGVKIQYDRGGYRGCHGHEAEYHVQLRDGART